LDLDKPTPVSPLNGEEEAAKTERLAALGTVVERFKFKRRDAARDSMVVMLLCNSDNWWEKNVSVMWVVLNDWRHINVVDKMRSRDLP
jgi:hypothetical protein